jgi:hypothetical protein
MEMQLQLEANGTVAGTEARPHWHGEWQPDSEPPGPDLAEATGVVRFITARPFEVPAAEDRRRHAGGQP